MSWFQCQHHMYVCIYNVKPCRSIVWSFPLRTLNNNWRQSASFLPQMTNWWAACVDFKAPVQILWHSPSCTWSQKSIRRELYRNCNYHLAFRKYILSTKRNSYSTEQFYLPAKNWYVRKVSFVRSRVCHMSTLLIHVCNEIRSHPNSFHCICRHCRYIQLNYNVDSNTKSSNYSKVWFKALITLNYNRVWIKTSN